MSLRPTGKRSTSTPGPTSSRPPPSSVRSCGQAGVTRPSPAWVTGKVRVFLEQTEGIDVD